MTPDTTPAPMTHGGDDVFIPKPCCIRADGACFEEGECLSDCEALDRELLRGANERELRQRLERAERERKEWREHAESERTAREAAERERDEVAELNHTMARVSGQYASERNAAIARAEAAERRVGELEAGIERLAGQWRAKHAKGGHGTDILDCADELRSLLRITHEEGRDG